MDSRGWEEQMNNIEEFLIDNTKAREHAGWLRLRVAKLAASRLDA